MFSGSNFVGGTHENGFGLRFAAQADGLYTAETSFDPLKQGPSSVVHGGALAAVIDEAMTSAVFGAGIVSFTVNLNIDYRVAVFIGQTVRIQAKIERIEGRKIYLKAHILLPDERVAVEASGLFVQVSANATSS